jgi:hypothetical protein
MRLSLDAERAGQPRPHYDRKPKGPDVWRRLLELSHDSDARVRHWVVESVRDGSPVRWRRVIVGRLMVLSEDSDAKVRRSAKKALDSYRSAAQLDFFARATETIASK